MNRQMLFFYVFFLFLSIPVFSQEDAVYVINSFAYNIDGITRPFAINYKAEFTEGEEITGLSNLQRFLQEKTQILVNERVFESVRIDHTIGEANPDGKYPVDLVIHVKDTWNIIAIPYPRYSSNDGFSLTLKARDYNFLGTMSPLRIDIGYQIDEDGQTSFSLMLDSDIPFRAFGLNWNLDFDHDLEYRPHLDEPWYYKNTTGISVELPFRRTTFTVGFAESFIVYEENPRRYRDEHGRLQEGIYMSSRPYISWKIPTGLHYYDLGEITYTPQLSATFNHEFSQWPLADFRKGPFINFSHSFDFGRIDWIGNFRRGVSASIENSFSYNFYYLRDDLQPWGGSFTVSGIGYTILNDFAGF